jgi:molybdopterin synthase sulfur carrier subunit
MRLRVLYFARLRESLGVAVEDLEVPPNVATVAQLRAYLIDRGAEWADAFAPGRRIRAALNQDMVDENAPLTEDAEVAFFPPVTGG